MAKLKNTRINDSGSLQLPLGSTLERPTNPTNGMVRYNTTLDIIEHYDGEYSKWYSMGYLPPIATGGTVTNVDGYRIHKFTTVGTGSFEVTRGGEVEYLIVGGGGGAGMDMGAGGGGGGVLQGTTTVISQTYDVFVGAGGWGAPAGGGGYRGDGAGPQPSAHQFTIPATSGNTSSVFGLNAFGGGRGGSSYYGYTPGHYGANGSSGGGVSAYSSDTGTGKGGKSTPGQGFRGGDAGPSQYWSGGGGGAGERGPDANNQPFGGYGIPCSILGTTYMWGGGGGSASYSTTPGGNGGEGGGGGGAVGTTIGGSGFNSGSAGGGGTRSSQTNTPGGDGGANTGGGGGGGAHYNATNEGGDGGSGIVVIRYRIG